MSRGRKRIASIGKERDAGYIMTISERVVRGLVSGHLVEVPYLVLLHYCSREVNALEPGCKNDSMVSSFLGVALILELAAGGSRDRSFNIQP